MQYNCVEYKSEFIRYGVLSSALMIATQLSISPLPLRGNFYRGNIHNTEDIISSITLGRFKGA